MATLLNGRLLEEMRAVVTHLGPLLVDDHTPAELLTLSLRALIHAVNHCPAGQQTAWADGINAAAADFPLRLAKLTGDGSLDVRAAALELATCRSVRQLQPSDCAVVEVLLGAEGQPEVRRRIAAECINAARCKDVARFLIDSVPVTGRLLQQLGEPNDKQRSAFAASTFLFNALPESDDERLEHAELAHPKAATRS